MTCSCIYKFNKSIINGQSVHASNFKTQKAILLDCQNTNRQEFIFFVWFIFFSLFLVKLGNLVVHVWLKWSYLLIKFENKNKLFIERLGMKKNSVIWLFLDGGLYICSLYLLCKSMDWFLYDWDFRWERVKGWTQGSGFTAVFVF